MIKNSIATQIQPSGYMQPFVTYVLSLGDLHTCLPEEIQHS